MSKKNRKAIAAKTSDMAGNQENPEEKNAASETTAHACKTFGSIDPDNPVCQTCNADKPEEYEACLNAAMQSKSSKTKSNAKKAMARATKGRMGKFSSLAELRNYYSNPDNLKIGTAVINSILIKGGKNLSGMLKDIQDQTKELPGSNGSTFKQMKNTSVLKSHIAWLQKAGWKIACNEVGKYAVVGYGSDIDIEAEKKFIEEGHKEMAEFNAAQAR